MDLEQGKSTFLNVVKSIKCSIFFGGGGEISVILSSLKSPMSEMHHTVWSFYEKNQRGKSHFHVNHMLQKRKAWGLGISKHFLIGTAGSG